MNKTYCLIVGLILSLTACQENGANNKQAATPSVLSPEVAATAQPSAPSPDVPTEAKPNSSSTSISDSLQAATFIPAGYKLLDATTGDLNLDALPDKVLVLQKLNADTATMGDTINRPLLLLLGQPNQRYKLAARNDRAVMCSGCGGMMGDPYQGITIKKGYFSLEYYGGSGWRWTHISTFKYAPADKQWYLYREGGESFHAADPEKVETHIGTVRDFGRIAFPDYDYETRLGE